jgi:hypothetical protein
MKLGTPHSTVGRKRLIVATASGRIAHLELGAGGAGRPCATEKPTTMPERMTL